MTRPQLVLSVCHPSQPPTPTPLHTDTDRTKLWELVKDERVHLILREPGLLELARRRDPELLDFCENMLVSGDIDDWFTAIKTIASIGIRKAIDRLVMLYASSLSDDRRFITNLVAKGLTVDHVHPFSIMIRELAVPGELDITGWTSTAVATLQEVCKRQGIEIILVGRAAYQAGRSTEDFEVSLAHSLFSETLGK
ncbi:MAG: hypothetical protein ACTSV2_03190 [Candidatus Thorarchaeota archaeon]